MEAEFAALHSRAVLAVHDGEGGEFRLAAVDAVGIVAQSCLDILDLLARDDRIDGDDLRLDLEGHIGDAVFGEALEVSAHLAGSGLDILGEFLLDGGDDIVIAHHLHELLAQLGHRLAEIFLHLLFGSEIGDEEIDAPVGLGDDLIVRGGDGVDLRLM